MTTNTTRYVHPNFISDIIDQDQAKQRYPQVVTRFPPEPNGYLHLGHAKSICLNFGLALDYNGACNLRFDDTNPQTEDPEYVASIEQDVRWLGFSPQAVLFASDYFEKFYECALQLIQDGLAYVDSTPEEEMRALRGTVLEAGRASVYRSRSAAENIDMLARMRAGEFAAGSHVLRAKIDLSHPNMKLRDPVLYRIVHAEHYNTGNSWCIYPLYDFAHPLEDIIEGVSHSICTLEFENNRDIYDWLLENLRGKCGLAEVRPYQYEFARLALDYTVLSKRKLIQLVQGNHVRGWDDPRMPTISAMRRRGVRPEALREFANRIGVAKNNSRIDLALLDGTIRDDLNTLAPRVLAVHQPLKVTIRNYPNSQTEQLEVPYWPHDVPKTGSRMVPFSGEIYIEHNDFAENPPKGFQRLVPDGSVRLRYGYNIRCEQVLKDEQGQVMELICSYDPESREQAKGVKGIIHWVSAQHALPAEFRLYERLFSQANPDEGDAPFTDHLNPHSLQVSQGYIEPSVTQDAADSRYQFERLGYFWRDPVDSQAEALVFNRIVGLRDHWQPQATQNNVNSQPDKANQTAKTDKATKANTAESSPKVAVTLSEDELAAIAPYVAQGLSSAEATLLLREPALLNYLNTAAQHGELATLANWVLNDLAQAIRSGSNTVRPEQLAQLVARVQQGEISGRMTKDVLLQALELNRDPNTLVEEQGLRQVSSSDALEPIIDGLFERYPDKVTAYRSGKTGMLGFFVGQVMRETQGQANPQVLNSLLTQKLQGE